MSGSPAPFLVGELDDELRRHLARGGRRVVHGWCPEEDGWALDGVVCVGAVSGPEELADALDAAARGAGLVVTHLDDRIADAFFDDCRRLGLRPHDPRREAGAGGSDEPEWAPLLEALADGASLEEAARRCFVSRRTAYRRLQEACAALGAASNTAAVVEWRRRNGRVPEEPA